MNNEEKKIAEDAALKNIYINEIEKLVFRFSSIGGYFNDDKKDKESLCGKFEKEAIETFNQKIAYEFNGEQYFISGNISYTTFNNSVVIGLKYATPPMLERKEYNSILEERVKFRAYIYMKATGVSRVDILPYGKKISSISLDEIEDKYNSLINRYIQWLNFNENWETIRNESIENMSFPYDSYRDGQEKFMRDIYRIIVNKGIAIAQAPTGTGKTLSALFPSTKSIPRGYGDKIFYLTAKTVGVRVAEESLDKMREKGLKAKSVTITAKEKVCLNEEVSCNVQKCPYAINHYGRAKNAILDMLSNEDNFNRDCISYYASKYLVCPYELSLELSNLCDIVIADYNYVFDFGVNTKLFPEDRDRNKKNIFLVDEAHNLVDRSRGMFSATLDKGKILNAAKELQPHMDFGMDLFTTIVLDIEELEKNEKLFKPNKEKLPRNLIKKLTELHGEITSKLRSPGERFPLATALDLISMLDKFIAVSRYFDEDSTFYLERMYTTIKDCRLKIFCINPNKRLLDSYKKAEAVIEFSATFAPMGYFNYLLGDKKKTYSIAIENPFPRENKQVIVVNNISTRLKDRNNSYKPIAEHIKSIIEGKVGNYMVFAPSFEYLDNVLKTFNSLMPNIKTINQVQGMSEDDRATYIEEFVSNPQETMVSFNVVSGLFAEGIDLVGDKLIGSIIIGPALPTFDTESQIVQDYFNSKGVNGYNVAYTYPGFNKVLQAAGRVIRTNTDKGIIALIDDRFDSKLYRGIYPSDWDNIKTSSSTVDTKNIVKEFWDKF